MSTPRMQPQHDVADSIVNTTDQAAQENIGVSLLNLATVASIGASVVLFLSGKKQLALFVGLWPPTFLALKASIQNKNVQNRNVRTNVGNLV